MAKVVVIGAGPMGLAAAYEALLQGHEVEVLEGAEQAGGMAAHFDFGGLSIEKFYHFICKSDEPTFELLRELGISGKLHWVPTTMGLYYQGALHKWGDPMSLVRLPGASLLTKIRYGLLAFLSTRRDRWPALEQQSAREWLTRWCGRKGFEVFWKQHLDLKFFEYADRISAAWIWTRIRRIGRSRASMMQESLGYLEGGSECLVHALTRAIRLLGGKLRLGSPAVEVKVRDGQVYGVETRDGLVAADAVISTLPVQHIPALVPDLPEQWKEKYRAIDNIGVCCVVFKLKRQLTPHFWVNISDARHGIPGVIEFSNLRPMENAVVYVPFYMPVTNPRFSQPDEELIASSFACLQMLNASLSREDVLDTRVARLRYGQPICDVGFAAKIPPIETPIRGLQVADTCYYYPEDRGIAESVRVGRNMARAIAPGHADAVASHLPAYAESA